MSTYLPNYVPTHLRYPILGSDAPSIRVHLAVLTPHPPSLPTPPSDNDACAGATCDVSSGLDQATCCQVGPTCGDKVRNTIKFKNV